MQNKKDNKNNNKEENNCFSLLIGKDEKNEEVKIPLPSLYQNILITGAIGSGKTSCTIYPFLMQLFKIPHISGLILDVKGNMKNTIISFAKSKNIIIIEINGKYKYNPLHKPNLKPHILADRLVTILKLFSNTNSTDTYWFDKALQMLTESIKLIRLYNNRICKFY